MSKPKGVITPKKAKQLNDEFNSRCALVSKDIVKRPDNRSSWWSLEDIRNYLDYAEKQAKELGHEMNGIRVYCGAYPTVKGKKGYSTMFIAPTAEMVDGKGDGGGNGDIPGGDPLNGGENGDPPNSGYPQQ